MDIEILHHCFLSTDCRTSTYVFIPYESCGYNIEICNFNGILIMILHGIQTVQINFTLPGMESGLPWWKADDTPLSYAIYTSWPQNSQGLEAYYLVFSLIPNVYMYMNWMKKRKHTINLYSVRWLFPSLRSVCRLENIGLCRLLMMKCVGFYFLLNWSSLKYFSASKCSNCQGLDIFSLADFISWSVEFSCFKCDYNILFISNTM